MPANKDRLAVDHIDPQWSEGRDYQLVCGLECGNLRLSDDDINIRKSNRFVPYRVVDWLAVHQEPGDWGIFLINGEWRLTQFMGREWWEESDAIGHGIQVARQSSMDTRRRDGFRALKVNFQRVLEANPDHQSEAGRASAYSRFFDPDHPELGQHNAGNLVRMQRKRGYPSGPSNRVKLTQKIAGKP